MSNIVKHTQFKTIVTELWNRVKTNFVKEVVIEAEDNKKKLKYIKGDNSKTEITKVITTWGDLDEVTEYKYANLLDYSKREENKWYGDDTGAEQNNNSWNIYKVDVKPSVQYTVFKKNWDTNRFVFLNANGGVVRVQNFSDNGVSGWRRQYVTVPSDSSIVQMGLCSQKLYNNEQQLMVLEGANITEQLNFIPYLDGGKVSVNKKVCHVFDNTNTALKSKSLDSAIKEIDNRLASCVNKGESKIVIGGHTALVDGNVIGYNARYFKNALLDEVSTKETEFFTCDEFSASGDVSITQITIAMDERIPAGTVVNGVNVAVAVHSGNTNYFIKPQDIYLSNGTAVVYETVDHATLGSRKAITVDVDVSLRAGQKLVIGAKGMRWGRSSSSSSTSGEHFPSKDVTQNTSIQVGAQAGKVGSAILHADETPLRRLIKSIEPTQVSGHNTGLRVTRADGSWFILNWNFTGQQVSKTQQGQTRRFVFDPASGVSPFSFTRNVEDNETEVDRPITDSEVVRKFSTVFGVKVEMDGECWLKCEGQTLTNANTGQPITLPMSTDGDYIYMCLGH